MSKNDVKRHTVRYWLVGTLATSVSQMDSIPKDVIEHYLLPRLDLATLIVSCHVSKLFRKNSTNRFTSIWTNRFRNDIYEAHLEARHELYEIGSLTLFKWFEKFLKFPKFSQATPSHLEAAAQSTSRKYFSAQILNWPSRGTF